MADHTNSGGYALYGDHPLLSVEDEQELATRIAKGDIVARNQMIMCNIKLVIAIAREMRATHKIVMEFHDLVSEGIIGLTRAAEKFQVDKGAKFSTYASLWIRQAIFKAVKTQSRTIRVPLKAREQMSHMRDFIKEYEHENGHEPEICEIAEKLKLTVNRVRLLKTTLPTLSINKEVNLGLGVSVPLYQILADPVTTDTLKAEQRCLDVKDLEECLSILSEREQYIISHRYGLNGNTPLVLNDISKVMGVTRERIRQIQNQALRKLRRFIINKGFLN